MGGGEEEEDLEPAVHALNYKLNYLKQPPAATAPGYTAGSPTSVSSSIPGVVREMSGGCWWEEEERSRGI